MEGEKVSKEEFPLDRFPLELQNLFNRSQKHRQHQFRGSGSRPKKQSECNDSLELAISLPRLAGQLGLGLQLSINIFNALSLRSNKTEKVLPVSEEFKIKQFSKLYFSVSLPSFYFCGETP